MQTEMYLTAQRICPYCLEVLDEFPHMSLSYVSLGEA